MKKGMLVTMIVLLVVANVWADEPNQPEMNDAITARIFTEPTLSQANIEGWLGIQKDNSEIGLILGFLDESTDEDSSMTIGAFAAYHFPDIRENLENIFWPIDFMPETIEAEPSIGLSGTYNLETETLRISPFVGLKIFESIEIVTSYNAFGGGTPEADRWQIGISKIWRF